MKLSLQKCLCFRPNITWNFLTKAEKAPNRVHNFTIFKIKKKKNQRQFMEALKVNLTKLYTSLHIASYHLGTCGNFAWNLMVCAWFSLIVVLSRIVARCFGYLILQINYRNSCMHIARICILFMRLKRDYCALFAWTFSLQYFNLMLFNLYYLK